MVEHGLPTADAARVLAAVGHAVTVTDGDGRVTFWNPAAERLYGWSAAEATGRRPSELSLPQLAAEDPEVSTALGAGEPWVSRCTVRHRDGRDVPVQLSTTGLYDDQRRLVGAVAVSTGLAAAAEVERRAAHLQTALESRVVIEQAKGFLAARHDVTPAQGFEALRRYARSNHLVMHDAARRVVRGELEVPVPYQGDRAARAKRAFLPKPAPPRE